MTRVPGASSQVLETGLFPGSLKGYHEHSGLYAWAVEFRGLEMLFGLRLPSLRGLIRVYCLGFGFWC